MANEERVRAEDLLRMHRAQAAGTRPANLPAGGFGEGPSFTQIRETEKRLDFIEQNKEYGIPVDVSTGVGPLTRARLSFRGDDKEQQMRFLQSLYGENGVRELTDGSLAVRTRDDEGDLVDVVVNPKLFDLGDIAGMADTSKELAAELLAFRGINALSKVAQGGAKRLIQAGGAAITGQVAGGLGDAWTDSIDGTGVDLGEIVSERTKMSGVDFLLGYTGAKTFDLAARAAKRAPNPFGASRGEEEKLFKETVDRLNENFNRNFQPRAGELTGSGALQRVEGIAANVDNVFFQQLERRNRAELAAIGRELFQLDEFGPIPTAEELSVRLSRELERQSDTLRIASGKSREGVLRAVKREIMDEFDMITGGRPFAPDTYPKRTTAKKYADYLTAWMHTGREVFRKDADTLYSPIVSDMRYTDDLIDGSPIASWAEKQEASLPKKRYVEDLEVTTPDGKHILDAQGKPIMVVKKGEKAMTTFIPPGFRTLLDDLKSMKGAKTSMSELLVMRRKLHEMMDEADPIPGVSTKRLSVVSSEITGLIDNWVKGLPDDSFKKQYFAASNFYRNNVDKFRQHGVKQLLIDPSKPGGAQPIKFVNGLWRDADAYENILKVLGEGSDEAAIFKRSMLQQYLSNAGAVGLGADMVDGHALYNALKAADSLDGGHIINDILPNGLTKRIESAIGAAVKARQKNPARWSGEPIKFPFERVVMEELSTGKTKPVAELKRLAINAMDSEEFYKNSIVKTMIGDGEIPRDFDPSRFYDTFYKNSSLTQAQATLAVLEKAPELKRDVKRKAIQHILMKADRASNPRDLLGDIQFGKRMSGTELRKAMGDETEMSVLEELLGADTIGHLEDVATVLTRLEKSDEVAQSVGGLTSGSIVNQILTKMNRKAIEKLIGYKLISVFMTSPRGIKMLNGSPSLGRKFEKAGEVMGTAWVLTPAAWTAMAEEAKNEAERHAMMNAAIETFELGSEDVQQYLREGNVRAEDLLREYRDKN